MSHNDHCPALTCPLECRLHEPLTFRIERTCRFVQEEDARVTDEGTGNGEALLLSAREGNAPRADVGVIPFREGDNKVVNGGIAAGLVKLFVCCRGRVDTEQDVLSDRALEQSGFLSYQRQILAVSVYIEVGDVLAVAENVPAIEIVKPDSLSVSHAQNAG
jgi:hypothetical protein